MVQETRLWDANAGVTVSMRSKEEAHDYRYFPDPDLLPLVVDDSWVEEVRGTIPEMPAGEDRAARARSTGSRAMTRGSSRRPGRWRISSRRPRRSTAGTRRRRRTNASIGRTPSSPGTLSPETIAHAVEDRERGTISATASKKLVELVLSTGKTVPDASGREVNSVDRPTSVTRPNRDDVHGGPTDGLRHRGQAARGLHLQRAVPVLDRGGP